MGARACAFVALAAMCATAHPAATATATVPDWSAVDAVLDAAVVDGVIPGCVAAVASTTGGLLRLSTHGVLASSASGGPRPLGGFDQPTRSGTRYDLASLTKVIATTTAAALLHQYGVLELDMAVSDPTLLGPAFGANGKGAITVRNLLLHNAGYPPDPSPNYWDQAFGCPEPVPGSTQPPHFNCMDLIYSGLMAQTLQNPVGTKYVYSDLSMITMQFVIGELVQQHEYVGADDMRGDCASSTSAPLQLSCHYEAFVRVHVLDKSNMFDTGFLPDPAQWATIAPTWNDTNYRHRLLQGVVSDGNSFALGGIAGHAGLFSTAGDLVKLLVPIMEAVVAPDDQSSLPSHGVLTPETARLFTTVGDEGQSARALGWDTNLPGVNTYRGCGNLSATTYTHTGYTGTQVCNDPTRRLVTVLLTNRAYPHQTANFHGLHLARQAFNNAVRDVVDVCGAACGGVCPCHADGGGSGSGDGDNSGSGGNPGDGAPHGLRIFAIVTLMLILCGALAVWRRDRIRKHWSNARYSLGGARARGVFRGAGQRGGGGDVDDGADIGHGDATVGLVASDAVAQAALDADSGAGVGSLALPTIVNSVASGGSGERGGDVGNDHGGGADVVGGRG